MPPFAARRLAESLVDTTVPTPTHGNPNRVLSVDGANFRVATDESPEGEPVSLAQLQRGLDLLLETGQVRIAPETFGGYRRSSAIGAVLAAILDVARPSVKQPCNHHDRDELAWMGQEISLSL